MPASPSSPKPPPIDSRNARRDGCLGGIICGTCFSLFVCVFRTSGASPYDGIQPLRSVGLRYLLASELFVNRILAASHSSFPSTLSAITPSNIHSTNGAATLKLEHAASPPLQARIQSR